MALEGDHTVGDLVVAGHSGNGFHVGQVGERDERGLRSEANAEELFAYLQREASAVLAGLSRLSGEAPQENRCRSTARDEHATLRSACIGLDACDHSERVAIDRSDRIDLPRRRSEWRLFDMPRTLNQRQECEGEGDLHAV
jgi:hypothetical protein